MAKKVVAYAWRSGEIGIGDEIPNGALPIARSENRQALEYVISACARHAYDGVSLLVPGVPEAQTDGEALEALAAFHEAVESSLQRAA